MNQVLLTKLGELVVRSGGLLPQVQTPTNYDQTLDGLLDALANASPIRSIAVPVNPQIGQRWTELDTDQSNIVDWQWDGTNWVTVDYFQSRYLGGLLPLTYATASAAVLLPRGANKVKIIRGRFQLQPQSPCDGSNYWVINSYRSVVGDGVLYNGWRTTPTTFFTIGASIQNTDVRTDNLTNYILPAGHQYVGYDITKVGSPGSLGISQIVYYQGVR